MTKHRETFKKTKLDLELDDDYDEDLDELRWERYLKKEEEARTKEASRWAFYFHRNGYCMMHDTPGCGQCQCWAMGVCPSYWEEFADY